MNSRGFTLIELMIVIAILGLLGMAATNAFSDSSDAEQEAYQLLSKTNQLIAASKSYYQSSCNAPDFQLTLNKLKQETSVSNDFTYPAHNLSLTHAGTPKAYLHLQVTIKPAVAVHFVGMMSGARATATDTVVISVPVATAISSDRDSLVTMKNLWGESLC